MALTDQAITKIKDLIVARRVRARRRLPKEIELAERLGLSRNSLREAVRALSLVGVLEARQGDGTYVTSLEPDLLLAGTSFVSDLLTGPTLLRVLRGAAHPRARRDRRWRHPRLAEEDFEALEDSHRPRWTPPRRPRRSSTPTSTSIASSSTPAATPRSHRSSRISQVERCGRASGARSMSETRSRARFRCTTTSSVRCSSATRNLRPPLTSSTWLPANAGCRR